MHTIRRCLGALMSLLAATAVIAAAPTTTDAGRPTSCPQFEDLLRAHAPAGGWDVAQMSAIIARESGCVATAKSARDSGLLQINQVNYGYLTTALGEAVNRDSLGDPVQNVRAGAALCTYWQGRGQSCYFPWKLDLYQPPTTTTTVAAPAAPATPAPPALPGRCTEYESILQANAPAAGWDVERMSKIMWRTSRCVPTKKWSTGTGLLRISNGHLKTLTTKLGAPVDRTALTDPTLNVRAAAVLCQASVAIGRSCYRPWGG